MELANANDEKQEIQKCGHFSIRGYVAEIRKKDSKTCWPFPAANSKKDVEDQAMLPPLHVADFRWWGCENCLNKTAATSAETETREFVNHQNVAFKPSTCCHRNSIISSHVDALKLYSGLQQTSREKILVGTNVDSHITVDLYDHEFDPPLCSDKKEKKAAVVQPIGEGPCTSIGHDGSAESNLNHAAYRTSSSMKGNVNLNFKPDNHLSNLSTGETAIACELPVHQHKNISHECCGVSYTPGFSGIVLDKRKQKRTSTKTSTQMCRKENPELGMNNAGKVASENMICVVDVDKNEALNTVSESASKIHLRDLDESDYESSKDDEDSIRNNIDDGGSLPKRKTRKLRLLNDIIKSEAVSAPSNEDRSSREENDNHIKMVGVLSKSERDACTRIGPQTDSKSPMLLEVNDQGLVLSKKKKGKMPRDEFNVPFKVGCPSSMSEEVGPFKGDANSSVLRRLDSISSSYLVKHGKNVKFNFVKKKSKIHHVEDGECSLVPRQEGVQRVVQKTERETIKFTEADTVRTKSAEDESTRRGSHPGILREAAAQSYAKKVIFSENKRANSCVKDGKASLKPWKERITEEDPIIIGDIDVKYKKATAIPLRPPQDAFAGKQNDLNHVSAYRKRAMSKKQNSIFHVETGANMPQFESRAFSVMCRPEVSSGTCNYEKSIAQRHPLVLKDQFDQTTSKTSDQAALDDIPMEIVELMAKNQHDRRLSNSELAVTNSYCSSRNTEKGKVSGPPDLTEVLGNEMLRLLHEKKSLMSKAHFNNEESYSRKVGPTKRKSDGYISQGSSNHNTLDSNISQLEQYHVTMRPQASCHELSGGNQFSVGASSRNCSNQNFSWNEDVLGHRCSSICLKSSEGSCMRQTLAQHGSGREDQHFWSSMAPNGVAFKINNHQKFNTQTGNFGTVSQCLDLFPQANMIVNHGLKSPNMIHLEKQNSKFDSETNKRLYVDHPFVCRDGGNEHHQKTMGPLDFYANETIPAMHLLRLMDAGVSSTAPLNADKSQEFSKQASFPYNHPCKDFTELEVGKHKHIHQPASDSLLRSYHLGKSCYHLHSDPKDNCVGTSLKKDDNVRSSFASRCIVSTKWVPDSDLQFQAKGKTKSKKPPRESKGRKSNRSVFESSSIHDLQKGFLSISNSMPLGIQSQGIDDSGRHLREDVNNKTGATWPLTRSCRTELCAINRNPADFTVPEAGNTYMIGPGDLRRGKMSMPRGRSGLTDLEGHKRQRVMKLTSI